MVRTKNQGRALAVLLAFAAPLSALAQDVPAHNPEGTISISGTVERAAADELAIKPRKESDVITVNLGAVEAAIGSVLIAASADANCTDTTRAHGMSVRVWGDSPALCEASREGRSDVRPT